ncbi:MAG: AAA domain-containing protein, partial [Bacteroidota bacterium]
LLKNLVKCIYDSSDSNILVLAYTNRAVDEICSVLKRIRDEKPDVFSFIRLGSKESSEHTDVLISKLAETYPIEELIGTVKNTRIIVSTVSSVLTNPEIMRIKKFHYAIIDEASQILEPQIIGILSQIEKFIMIGDEKQLPAIVVQNSRFVNINNENLQSIELNRLDGSLFERLLKICKNNNWEHAFGMLTSQARMHKIIQDFPNHSFYDGELKVFDNKSWQTATDNIFSNESDNAIERILAKSRIIFIESPPEDNRKVNFQEAKTASLIAKTISSSYNSEFTHKTLGIIAPFRAQCYEILKNLPEELTELVTVDTVERFQGSERDCIIISFALNNVYQLKYTQNLINIGDYQVDRKLNVALTRAKKHLIMLGNSEVLSQSSVFNSLIQYVKNAGGYFSND